MTLPLMTAIIPAYNEEATIADVVRVLVASGRFAEVVVVSDGSTDHTVQRAQEAGARVVVCVTNVGKGEAMQRALSQTSTPYIAFFDADLRGLCTQHIDQLVQPVLEGRCAMNIGLRDRGWVNPLLRYLPLISGERALHRCVMESIPPRYLTGYGVEVSLNYACKMMAGACQTIVLKGVSIRRKYEKVGLARAVLQYGRMAFQVVSAMIRIRIAY